MSESSNANEASTKDWGKIIEDAETQAGEQNQFLKKGRRLLPTRKLKNIKPI